MEWVLGMLKVIELPKGEEDPRIFMKSKLVIKSKKLIKDDLSDDEDDREYSSIAMQKF